MKRSHYDLIDSTNLEARRLADRYPGQRLLVTADRQSAGRGRQGRVWQSPAGGAWMSIVWPVETEPRVYAPVSIVTAVAVRRALCQLSASDSADLRIKWPNDLLLAGCKVAGILCEQSPGQNARPGILIIGIGVNVNLDPGLLAGDLRHPAISLRRFFDRPFDLEEVIAAVSDHVTDALQTFELEGLGDDLLTELRNNLAYVGTARTWASPRGEVTGRVLGVDPAGRLLLDCSGKQVACEVGELVHGSAAGR